MLGTNINLNISSISNVPLGAYENFTFIVNGESFQTTKIVADLLSNKICRLHLNDPTLDSYTIITKQHGDFSIILELSNFKNKEISKSEIPFISEVFEELECNSFDFTDSDYEVITNDNVLKIINQNDKNMKLYSKYQDTSCHFIATHFYEMYKNNQTELLRLPEELIHKILTDTDLFLESEDQLFDFVTQLYFNNKEYASMIEYVQLQNVSVSYLKRFLEIFNFEDMTKGSWNSFINRLLLDPCTKYTIPKTKRYHNLIKIEYQFNNNFKGILNYIRSKTPNSIFKEIKITSSSLYNNDESYSPQNVIQYENPAVEFCTKSIKDSWICFDFINHLISPTHYKIRSCPFNKNSDHPKSWNIEGSNDGIKWELLDSQNNNSSLNGINLVSSFEIKNPESKKYRFLRMKQLESWRNNADYFNINCIEFYGELI